jgi:hypothetical protein
MGKRKIQKVKKRRDRLGLFLFGELKCSLRKKYLSLQ